MSTNITITKLSGPIRSGDWHDAPLRWAVCGPLTERQLFATKRDATVYKRLRRSAQNEQQAQRAFILHD